MKVLASVPTRSAVPRSPCCCSSSCCKASTSNKRAASCSHKQQQQHGDRQKAVQTGVMAAVTAAATGLQQLPAAAQEAAASAAAAAAAAGAGSATPEQVAALTSTYVPGPVDLTWQIYVGTAAGIIPFLIGAYEFGKRIIIQRRCPRCMGSGLVERGGRLRKCPDCGGFFPWQSWGQFLSATATPGNGGPLLQPKGQSSVLYKVPDSPSAQEVRAVQEEEAAIREAGREALLSQQQQQQQLGEEQGEGEAAAAAGEQGQRAAAATRSTGGGGSGSGST